jgi:FkbM family methyltransferase
MADSPAKIRLNWFSKFAFFLLVVGFVHVSLERGRGGGFNAEKTIAPSPKKPCRLPREEVLFNTIVQGLFEENVIPDGDVLDIGANTGDWSCYFACLFRDRIFHAADPNELLKQTLPCKDLSNVHVHTLAMSNAVGKISFKPKGKTAFVGSLESKNSAKGNVDVTTLDIFFQSKNSHPAFMHLDVEGYEPKLLQGGRATINATRPIFSFEVHMNQSESVATIANVVSMGYSVFLVNEIAGWTESCRNMLALPQNTSTPLQSSQTWRLAVRSGVLLQVTVETAKYMYVTHTHKATPFYRHDNERQYGKADAISSLG